MNNLLNLVFSDFKIIKENISFKNKEIIFFFENAYDVEKSSHIGPTILKINNWTEIKVYKFISNDKFLTFEKTLLNESEIEFFDMIMEIKKENNMILLGGFSKQTGCWLNYEITNATCEKLDPASCTKSSDEN